jgi:hypothetical protein
MLSQIKQAIPYPLKIRLWLAYLWSRSLSGSLRMLPAFIIIGTQKGGTSSLYHYLTQHPQIFPAVEKEIRFFDYKYYKGLAWYRAHFPLKLWSWYKKAQQNGMIMTGEASPNYLFDPRAPRRLMNVLPNIKLIIMLRNPVDRAYSSYQMGVRRGWETLFFQEAVEIESERTKGELQMTMENGRFRGMNRHNYAYLERGRYVEQLRWWFDAFSWEQFHIIKSETFFTDPAKVVKQVFDFLELPACRTLDYRPVNVGHYDAMDSVTRLQLQKYFQPYNAQLYRLLGVDMGWEGQPEDCSA